MPITFFGIDDGEELLSMQLRQELINGMGVIMLSTYILAKVFRVKAKSHLLFAFWGFFDVRYSQVYPVGWFVHGSDDIICGHFVKFLLVKECVYWNSGSG